MSEVNGAEVLVDRERLLKALPGGEGLQGIVTTDRAEGLLYVLSRYEDPQWWLSKSKDTGNQRDGHRKLDFTRISGEQLRAEAKVVMARSIWAENSLANATIRTYFENLVHWLNWLDDQGIRSHTGNPVDSVTLRAIRQPFDLVQQAGKAFKWDDKVLQIVCDRTLLAGPPGHGERL